MKPFPVEPSPTTSLQHIDKCLVVFGDLSLEGFGRVSKGFSRQAVIDRDLAEQLGATLVMGEAFDIQQLRLRRRELPIARNRLTDVDLAIARGANEETLEWLQYGDRCASADTLLWNLLGAGMRANGDHPHDTADLRRCLRVLDLVDGRCNAGVLRSIAGHLSASWRALISQWDKIMDMHNSELAHGQQFDRTDRLIADVLRSASRQESSTRVCQAA